MDISNKTPKLRRISAGNEIVPRFLFLFPPPVYPTPPRYIGTLHVKESLFGSSWGLALCLGRGRIGSDLADAVGGREGGISPGDGLSIHSEKVRVLGGLKTCLGWKNYHRFVCCFNSTVNGCKLLLKVMRTVDVGGRIRFSPLPRRRRHRGLFYKAAAASDVQTTHPDRRPDN